MSPSWWARMGSGMGMASDQQWLQLALTGLMIAALPLSYTWVKGRRNRYRQLVWLTLFLTFDLILFGGFTRLTDSGLGCPDWPGCYGTANPFLAHVNIHAAEALMPSGPVTWAKAWIEMVHRYLAMMVGVLIIALMGLAWFKRRELRQSPWPATALFILVCVQGAFGAWTVTLKLQPVIVTLHLLLGLTLLASLAWLAARSQPASAHDAAAGRLSPWIALGIVLLAVQIALGGWVSTNYAVLACTDFPLCNGQLIPTMDFRHGFTLWRALGKTASGALLSHEALVAIHWTHRVFAVVVIAYLGWLALRARRSLTLTRPALVLLALIALQFASGLSNILLQWPLPIAVAHNGGAAALLVTLVFMLARSGAARSWWA
ncbi:MAG TPA: COX15/CtaA family protein [Sulfuriferula sp.]|nr:COX15/CtaA family protein [Sulfuriferula sp.]